jgi:hypothetical protein
MSETYTPKAFIVGDFPVFRENVTILSGQSLLQGAVLGKITIGTMTGSAKAGNTGIGAFSAITAGSKTKVGVYALVCISAGAAGIFKVLDPDGFRLDDLTAGSAYAGELLNFTLTNSGTAFVLGDTFSIIVADGSGSYKLVNSANVDGSQNPVAVLAEDVDASSADMIGTIYDTGEFSKRFVSFGGTDTVATHLEALKARCIFVREVSPG